jgi:GT2 family glycosyltransferase
VVVVVFDMPQQAMNTIYSLSPHHQQDVDGRDYEVVVVENTSNRMLVPDDVRAVAGNVRYVRRDEPGVSPAPALNAGVAASTAPVICLMVDGARMVTPGVTANILRAQGLVPDPVVSVPGYHLGTSLHQDVAGTGYSAEQEQRELESVGWRDDGYRLFDMAVPSASCSQGFLLPVGESNCLAMSRRVFEEIGGLDEQFVSRGGGFVNLDLYRRAVDRGTLVLLPGEGTFHQFHGGATTGAADVDRDQLLDEMRQEYLDLRGQQHAPPQQTPILLGRVPDKALPFFRHSIDRVTGSGH